MMHATSSRGESCTPAGVLKYTTMSQQNSNVSITNKKLFVEYWHLERAFLKRFPFTCLRTWCGCRLRCLRVSLQKSWLLEKQTGKLKQRKKKTTGVFSSVQIGTSISLRLFCAWHNMWLILAVVELCSSTQLLILLPFSELLKLLQVAWKLMAIQRALDLKTTRYIITSNRRQDRCSFPDRQ